MGHLVQSPWGLATLEHRVWDESRPWWPHKNLFTGKRMNPFKKAMRSRMESQHGPISVLYMDYVAFWTTDTDLIMYRLKGGEG